MPTPKLPRTTRKARGPIPDWRPNVNTRALLTDVVAILATYRPYWPLSIRAIYYALLGLKDPETDQAKYAKSRNFASRVSEHVGNARRAGLPKEHPLHIPWDAISDANLLRAGTTHWRSEWEWLSAIRRTARTARLIDLQKGQKPHLLVWCEARGMVDRLSTVADEYGVDVISTSGYDSTTVRHDEGLATPPEGLLVLHVGDLDDDGRKIFTAAKEDVEAWADSVEREASFERLAVTEQQVADLELPDDPEKAGNVQAEAIPPDVMARILREAIETRINEDVLNANRAENQRRRDRMVERLAPEAIDDAHDLPVDDDDEDDDLL
jgi:hypothetical protein